MKLKNQSPKMNPLANLISKGLVEIVYEEGGEVYYQLTEDGEKIHDLILQKYGHNQVEPN
jgi:predicted transcriptional regulator with HTH domain